MIAHESADFAHLGPGPIDIEAAAAVLNTGRFVATDTPDTERSAYAELGGIASTPPDERRLYLPYVDMLGQDPRKTDIHRGLGGLGLLVVAPADVRRFAGTGQRVHAGQLDFAAAALTYDRQLESKARTLTIPGQIDGLQQMYPDTDIDWAHEYVPQLKGLRDIFRDSAVFSAAQQVKKYNEHAVLTRMQALPKPHVEVHLNEKGRPVVVNSRNKNRSRAA